MVHFGAEIQRHADVVAARFLEQTALILKTLVEIGALQRRQQPDHRRRNAGLLNEFDLSVEGFFAIAIEPQNKSRRYLQTLFLNLADRVQEKIVVVAMGLWGLFG